MSKRLFTLRNVPVDEADEVRALLDREAFAWYETPASPFGISYGALWLRDAADFPRAKALLDDYQRTRAAQARGEHERAVRAGTAQTFGQLLRERPVFVIVTVGAMLFIVALTLALPWFLLG